MEGSNSIPKAFQIAEFLQKSVFLRLNRHTSFTPTQVEHRKMTGIFAV
jgi:hypothetical protein